MKPQVFNITHYKFDPQQKKAIFYYTYTKDKKILYSFSEEILLPRPPKKLEEVPSKILEETLKLVHIMLGMSYYKLFVPKTIHIGYPINKNQADFFKNVYIKGLGEFFYQNKISPQGKCQFNYKKDLNVTAQTLSRKNRSLFGVGGGKDSIVVQELLKEHQQITKPFIVNTQKESLLKKEVLAINNQSALKLERNLDTQLFNNIPHSYNGHVPITGMIASLAVLSCVLYDYNQMIFANEYSSNFGNINWKGIEINHQWSKSQEFETDFQNYIHNHITPNIYVYSLLRQFNEIRIAKMFSKYKKYFTVFSSCNKNFRIQKKQLQQRWCCDCPKCHFVFLILAPFITKKELQCIFGRNLFANENLIPAFKELLGLGTMKPFECVGTFEEAQAAFLLASKKYTNDPVIKKLLPMLKEKTSVLDNVFTINPAPNLPENKKLFGLKNCAIIGYGKEGKLTHKFLEKYHPHLKIKILDQQHDKNYLQKQTDFEFAFKTPGLPKENITIPYTTATNLFMSQARMQGHTIIGVTGTKGKSTTSSLIYSLLKTANKPVHLIGNIGTPMLSMLMKHFRKPQIFVVELSSYQLDDSYYAPHIAVCLNLFPEHMNYHGSIEKYYQAKSPITLLQNNTDTFIYNSEFKLLTTWAQKTKAHVIDFTKTKQPKTKTPLLGSHNQLNIQAALSVAKLFNLQLKTIQKTLRHFKPLTHRLELVGTFNDITFYDDAIATTPESTIAALETLTETETILLGGQDRGYDFKELEKKIHTSSIKNVVLFPDSGTRIFSKTHKLNILTTNSMKEAVQFAYTHTNHGKICLLSCASPSYSLWKNFEHKGDEFQKWVKKLK